MPESQVVLLWMYGLVGVDTSMSKRGSEWDQDACQSAKCGDLGGMN